MEVTLDILEAATNEPKPKGMVTTSLAYAMIPFKNFTLRDPRTKENKPRFTLVNTHPPLDIGRDKPLYGSERCTARY